MITIRVSRENRSDEYYSDTEVIEMATDQPWDPTVARDIRDVVVSMWIEHDQLAAELAEAEAADELEYETEAGEDDGE